MTLDIGLWWGGARLAAGGSRGTGIDRRSLTYYRHSRTGLPGLPKALLGETTVPEVICKV